MDMRRSLIAAKKAVLTIEVVAWFGLLVLLLIYVSLFEPDIWSYLLFEPKPLENPMYVSGMLGVLTGTVVARVWQDKFWPRLRSQFKRGVFHDLEGGARHFEASARPTEAMIALGVTAVSLVLACGGVIPQDIAINNSEMSPQLALRIVAYVLAAVTVGMRLGEGVATGAISLFFLARSFEVRLTPGHSDGAAGLGRIGRFYFWQAMILSAPGLFMIGWMTLAQSAVSNIKPDDERAARYGSHVEPWEGVYRGLLLFDAVIILLAVALPTLILALRMRDWRKRLIEPEQALLSTDVGKLRSKMAALLKGRTFRDFTEQERETFRRLEADVLEKGARLAHYQKLPTLPLPLSALLATVGTLLGVITAFLAQIGPPSIS